MSSTGALPCTCSKWLRSSELKCKKLLRQSLPSQNGSWPPSLIVQRVEISIEDGEKLWIIALSTKFEGGGIVQLSQWIYGI